MSYGKILSVLVCVGVLAVTACAPTKPIQTSTSWQFDGPPVSAALYRTGPMDMLELGRAVSHNAVDIYDPLATSFMVVPPARSLQPKQGSIPFSRGILVREKSVRVYSLVARSPAPELPVLDMNSISDPVPLTAQ